MPSPFPGMNPYLESDDAWEDFHNSFIDHARALLEQQIGGDYFVKIEVRLYIHELSAEERRYFGRADLGVAGTDQKQKQSVGHVAAAAGPRQLLLPAVDIERQAALEVRDRRQRRVITAIELLSPSNKSGNDRFDYLAKRKQVLASPVHLVEIDLLRGGQRPRPPELPPCDYYVLVSRCEARPVLDMWPIGLRERLPAIPIPLATPDPDLSLDLQECLDRTYDAANYGKYIYTETPNPPLGPDDAAWAGALVPKV